MPLLLSVLLAVTVLLLLLEQHLIPPTPSLPAFSVGLGFLVLVFVAE